MPPSTQTENQCGDGMNSRGFALTELIIVIAIIGIIVAVVSLDFNSWMKKASIDAQTKELNSDISDMRLRAIQTKRTHMALIDPTRVTFCSYSAEETINRANCTANPPDPARHGAYHSKFLKYQITTNGGDIEVDSRGLTTDFQTIVVNPSGTGASVDCLVVSATRINMGTYDGTKCVFK